MRVCRRPALPMKCERPRLSRRRSKEAEPATTSLDSHNPDPARSSRFASASGEECAASTGRRRTDRPKSTCVGRRPLAEPELDAPYFVALLLLPYSITCAFPLNLA